MVDYELSRLTSRPYATKKARLDKTADLRRTLQAYAEQLRYPGRYPQLLPTSQFLSHAFRVMQELAELEGLVPVEREPDGSVMSYDECTTRAELIGLALQDGYSLDDGGTILTIGMYEGEDVAVLYFDFSDADYSYDWVDGCSDWFHIRAEEYDLLPPYTSLASLPDWACVLIDSSGFRRLTYWDSASARLEMQTHGDWGHDA